MRPPRIGSARARTLFALVCALVAAAAALLVASPAQAATTCQYQPVGDINTKWVALGGGSGPLGCPLYAGEKGTADGVGKFTEFADGDIYWSPSTGAHDIRDAILTSWASYGWERGLGYPTSDQTKEGADGLYNTFTKGAAHYTPAGGVTASGFAVDAQRLATANVGGKACGTNTLGGTAFYGSCTGNGGQPEYWCADFAKWVWANTGVSQLGGLNALAASSYSYGRANSTLSAIPSVGAAAVFSVNNSTGNIHHVAIVTKISPDRTIETASGDWDGESGSEAHFSSTSKVVRNTPAYSFSVGTRSAAMGQYVVGYITPA